MAEQKKSDFVVSDRRKFTIEGDLRPDTHDESEFDRVPQESSRAPRPPQSADVGSTTAPDSSAPLPPQSPDAGIPTAEDVPPTPSASEQSEQAAAYKSQTADID